jgi:hypothetical protein
MLLYCSQVGESKFLGVCKHQIASVRSYIVQISVSSYNNKSD